MLSSSWATASFVTLDVPNTTVGGHHVHGPAAAALVNVQVPQFLFHPSTFVGPDLFLAAFQRGAFVVCMSMLEHVQPLVQRNCQMFPVFIRSEP